MSSLLDVLVHNHCMLDAIRLRKNLDSTVEVLKDALGVSRVTADKMFNNLKDASLITRHERRTVIARDSALFLGVSIGSTHTRLHLLGLDFEPFSREEIESYPYLMDLEHMGVFEEGESGTYGFSYATPGEGENTFEETRTLISKIICAFLQQAKSYYEDKESSDKPFPLMGIGLGVTGPVDYMAKVWRSGPRRLTAVWNISLLELIGYKNYQLAEELGIFFTLDNNAKTAMISEYQYLLEQSGGQFSEDIAVLYIGSGIGAAAIIDRQLLRGSHNLSGELGHLQIPTAGSDGKLGPFKTIEQRLADSKDYEQYLPYILNTINCVLGIDRVILIGHNVNNNKTLIPQLLERRMEFTVPSTQHYCKPETGRGVPGTSAMGAAMESYMSMCCYDDAYPNERINLAKNISW